MIEELVGALIKGAADSGITGATLILLVVSLCLSYAVYVLYSAKERQSLAHAEEIQGAASTVATLVEQLRSLSEGQALLTQMISTAAQSAGANRETLGRIEGSLRKG